MKITLVVAPILSETRTSMMPPLGVAYLSSCLRSKKHRVDLFDFNLEIEPRLWNQKILRLQDDPEIFINFLFPKYSTQKNLISEDSRNLVEEYIEDCAKKIINTNPDTIGFYVHRKTALLSLLLAKKIKEVDGKILIVFGGPDTTRERKGNFFIRTGFVDLVVIGEGEVTLLEIIEKLKMEGKIAYCSGTLINCNGEIIDCGERPLIKNLDSIPFPDFDGLPLQKYEFSGLLPIIASRGCVGNCIFCSEKSFWKHYRQRSIENIIQEIKQQRTKYNAYKFLFCDSLINGSIKLLNDLCDTIIEQKIEVYWGGNARIDPEMTPKLLKKMHKAGCRFLKYGIESGSQGVLDVMRKGVKIKYAKEVLENTYKANIWVYVYLIVGFPTETEADFIQTLRFMYDNRNNINSFYAHLFNIEAGSPLFKKSDEFEIIQKPRKFLTFHKKIADCFKYFYYHRHYDCYCRESRMEGGKLTLEEAKRRKRVFDSMFKHKGRLEEYCIMFGKNHKITKEDSIQVNFTNLDKTIHEN